MRHPCKKTATGNTILIYFSRADCCVCVMSTTHRQLRVILKARGRESAPKLYCINSTERPNKLAAVFLVIQNAKVFISAADEI